MTNEFGGNIKIFACSANKELASEIAQKLNKPLGLGAVTKFSDGETCVRIDEAVRGADVFIIQPTSDPVNDSIMNLLIMTDALKRASAGRITAVMPYFGYARQDRKARSRDPISAKLVSDLITTAGVERILTMDLHCDQLQGFFNIPLDHLRGMPIFANYFVDKFKGQDDVVVVSPDLGSVSRSRMVAERLDAPIAIIDKRRPKANVSEIMNIIGEFKNKNVILVDDMIDTAGSITNAANALKEKGAKSVYACCTHGVFSGSAIQKIQDSAIEELVTLNTVEVPQEKRIDKIKILSVAEMFAAAITTIHEGTSIACLFEQEWGWK